MTALKILRVVPMAIFMAIALPASSAVMLPNAPATTIPAKTDDARTQQLLQRLEEIRGMNKSELTSQEKKGLRKEVKEIRREMRRSSQGIYLSVGAVIIIILLLILLL